MPPVCLVLLSPDSRAALLSLGLAYVGPKDTSHLRGLQTGSQSHGLTAPLLYTPGGSRRHESKQMLLREIWMFVQISLHKDVSITKSFQLHPQIPANQFFLHPLPPPLVCSTIISCVNFYKSLLTGIHLPPSHPPRPVLQALNTTDQVMPSPSKRPNDCP